VTTVDAPVTTAFFVVAQTRSPAALGNATRAGNLRAIELATPRCSIGPARCARW
jgi:hypothetical protein